MIPIMHDVFWGPMAYAIVGGLAVATMLTLVFLPALYVAVNGIRDNAEPTAEADAAAEPAMAAAPIVAMTASGAAPIPLSPIQL
jgi:hypothetical protein